MINFAAIAKALSGLNGLDDATAYEAALAIGDTPEFDRDGKVVAALDDGRKLTLIWPE